MADGQMVVRSATMLPHNIEEAKQIATYLARSNLFGCKTPEQAFALMLLADAEGLHPAAAARDYHVIDGKPSLRADAMLARYMAAGGRIKWIKREPEEVSAEFSHASSGSVVITWDKKRAELAGFWGKANWRKHPVQMLSARVISEGVRASFPGVVAGIYTPEEVQDFDSPRQSPRPAPQPRQETVTEDGEVIDAEVAEPEGQSVPRVDVAPLDANGMTNREIKEVHARLARMLENCNSQDDLEGWLELTADELATLPEDVHEDLRGKYKARRDTIRAVAV